MQVRDTILIKPTLVTTVPLGTRYGFHIDTRGFGALQSLASVSHQDTAASGITLRFDMQHSPPPAVAAGMYYDANNDGTPLRAKAPDDMREVCIPFTPAIDCTAYQISLWLSRTGVPLPAVGQVVPKIRAQIKADSGGSPGALVGTAGMWVDAATLGVAPSKVDFIIHTADANLVASTPYWLCLDTSNVLDNDLNLINIHCKDVVGTSGCKVDEGGSYVAKANQEPWYEFRHMVYADTGAVGIEFDAQNFLGQFITRREDINLDLYNDFLRVKATAVGGGWFLVAHLAIIGDAISSPPDDVVY